MKTLLLTLLIIGLAISQTITVSPSTSCTCSQFLYSNGCNQNTLSQCQWSTKTSTCGQASCNNMASIQECLIARNRCYWNGNACLAFESCTKLVAQDNLICPQQNTQCYGMNGAQCQNVSTLSKCSKYTQAQCGQQGGYAGSDGICYYNGTNCTTASECSQIVSEQVCNKYIQNACYWSNGVCQQVQCSQLTVNTCKFIVQNLDPETVQPCYWTGTECETATSQLFLDQLQCQANTLLNYRWVQFQKNGICVSCAKQSLIPANSCSCSQFIFQIECSESSYCQWTGTACTSIPCTNIQNQLSCSNNFNCYWNIGEQGCQAFTNCSQLTGSTNLQCAAQSQNCPNYIQGTGCTSKQQSCSSYDQSTCDGVYGLNGYCYYEKTTCNTLTSCTQITNENLCNQLQKICKWQNNACAQLSCSSITEPAQCTYIAKGLSNTDVQACIWNGTACQSATNLLTLGDANCASNTDFTYYYSGSMCIKCNNIQVNSLPNQCACSQLYYQNDCQSNSQCTWSQNSCQDIACQNIQDQYICVQNLYCQWSKSGCANFRTCPSIFGKNQKECLAQSLNCPSSDGTFCQNRYYLEECNTLETENECLNALGSDGLCLWNSKESECGVLTSCSQILTQKNCGIYEYACSWTKAGACIASSCATFTTVQQCKFYYASLSTQRPIGCQWDAENNSCSQVGTYMTSFTSTTCYANTGHTARWNNSNSTNGYCVSCSQKYIPNPWKCGCQQIVSQVNCFQNRLCQWDTTNSACTEKACSALEEPVCVTSNKCMWSGTQCVQFTSCSKLNGKSNDECLSYSLYCPYNKKFETCTNIQQVLTCSDYSNYSECVGVKGIGQVNCQWNYSVNKCAFANCYQNYSQSACQIYSFMCYWNGGCQTRQCSNYETKQSCTYVYNSNAPNYMQSCQWLNGSCQNNIGQQFADAQSCFANSDGTSRWSSNTPNQGYCIPCGLPKSIMKFNDSCKCNQILNENECTSFSCFWNGVRCQDNSCNAVRSQFACLQMPQCYWNVLYSYCTEWSVNVHFCQTLQGNTSLECLAQSTLCPVSLNGICQYGTQLQTCSSIKNENMCVNSQGQQGLCTYENQSCKTIESCTQIKIYNICLSYGHLCQWNTETQSCIQLLCENITEQSECTYIFQSINSATLQYCSWNSDNVTCSAVTITQQSKNLQNCYSSTGGTYHWSNTMAQGYCVTCALNQVTMPDTCSCSQLTQIECELANPKCQYTNNSCSNSPCAQIYNSMDCSQVSSCMWQQGQCVQFTKCADISGATVLDCLAQSNQCPGVSEGKCQSKSDLSNCASYTQTTCTFGLSANDGLCYWADNACTTIKDCGSLDSMSLCSSLNKMCLWSEYFGKCVPQKCQDYEMQSLCTFVIVNLNNPFIELCEWQNGICQPYKNDYYYRYDEYSCYENSAHTYRWVKDDKRETKCQMCYSQIVYAFITILILIHF